MPTGQGQFSNRKVSIAKVSTIVIKACAPHPPRMWLPRYLALRPTYHKGVSHVIESCLDSGATACVMSVPNQSLAALRAQVQRLGLAELLRE